MDRIKEVGKEGICSECEKEKMIVASWEEKVFCQECFDKESKEESEKKT